MVCFLIPWFAVAIFCLIFGFAGVYVSRRDPALDRVKDYAGVCLIMTCIGVAMIVAAVAAMMLTKGR